MLIKRSYYFIVFFLIGIISLVSSFIYWFKNESRPVSTKSEQILFVVEKGRSASEIGEKLFSKGLIRNKLVFKLYVQIFDKTKNINAGEFELTPSMSLSEIVSNLGKGPKELWVTIPEGLRIEEIAVKVASSLGKEGVQKDTFIDEFLSLTVSDEGYLFPDTYLFPREATAKKVVDRLKTTFEEKYNKEVAPKVSVKFTKSEIVVMASILERETKSVSEKPTVSGILWKRIANDWPLQVDASVQYAVASAKCLSEPGGSSSRGQMLNAKCGSDDWWPILTLEDLNIGSSYNTYKYRGLPPAPISNPGIVTLISAANPEESDYWFYIHSPDGLIHYAATSEEHAANVRKYLGKM